MISRRRFIAQSLGGLALAQGVARAGTVGTCACTVECADLTVPAGYVVAITLAGKGVKLLSASNVATGGGSFGPTVRMLPNTSPLSITLTETVTVLALEIVFKRLNPLLQRSLPYRIPVSTNSARINEEDNNANVTVLSAVFDLIYTAPTLPGSTTASLAIRVYP